ncbi:15381_t:CDS:2, partial [Gigaspora margarita]
MYNGGRQNCSFSAADKEWLNNVEATLQKLSEWKLNEPELYESIRKIISSARDSNLLEKCKSKDTGLQVYDMPLFPLDYPNYLCLSHVWTDSERSNITSVHAGFELFLQNDTL